jgi:alanyl-tRNA synthetase
MPKAEGRLAIPACLDFGGEKIEVLDTKKENDLIVHFVKKLPAKVEAAAFAKNKYHQAQRHH